MKIFSYLKFRIDDFVKRFFRRSPAQSFVTISYCFFIIHTNVTLYRMIYYTFFTDILNIYKSVLSDIDFIEIRAFFSFLFWRFISEFVKKYSRFVFDRYCDHYWTVVWYFIHGSKLRLQQSKIFGYTTYRFTFVCIWYKR